MSMPKGYIVTKKRDDRTMDFATMSPVGTTKLVQDIAIKGTVYVADSDQAEAGSTDIIINATAHLAEAGDLIRFTSGAQMGQEQYVFEVTANTITLHDNLPGAPAASDEFDVLKAVTLTLGADGSFSGPVKFLLDGGIVDVTEDTVTPANNLPLPVKITSTTGDINITANDLNVQLSHIGVNADSTQIGDGTEIMLVNASGEAQVTDDAARISLAAILLDTAAIDTATASIDASIDVDLSTRASEVTAAAILADTAAIDTATASIDTSIDVALSTRASEVTVAAILADTAAIDTATASIDANIDVNLSTVATEITAAAILADTAAIDTATASIDANINVALSSRASEATLSLLNGKVTTVDTDDVTITSSALPTGAATEVTLSALNVKAATEITLAAILADTASIDASIDVNLSTVATEVTAAAILADTAIMSVWDTNAGAVGANTQRVQLTDESLAALENITVEIDPRTVLATTYTDTSGTNIPGNATNPLQLIASTATAIKKIQFADTTGIFLELMIGAAAAETRILLIGPGSDSTIEIDIPAATRVSIRSVESASAISVGSLAINYIG